MTEPIFEFHNITKAYDFKSRSKVALKSFSLEVSSNSILGLFGPSGSGKTTIAKLMKGLIKPSSGTLKFQNKLVTSRELLKSKEIQLVFQNPYESLSPKTKVIEMLIEPLKVFFRFPPALSRNSAERLAKELSIATDLFERYPSELSGGEKQRIALLRALLLHPKILICDEIVSSLDTTTAQETLTLLKRYQQRYTLTVVFVSHDITQLESLCDQLAFIYEGELISFGLPQTVLNASNHPFILESKAAFNWLKA